MAKASLGWFGPVDAGLISASSIACNAIDMTGIITAPRRECAFCGSTPRVNEIHYGKCPNCGAPMEL